jgi:branched-chain amino acid transport system permease protein
VALAGAIITAVVTGVFRQHFAAIEENELLAQSLGLVVWHYKAFGFLIAAGISGLAGFALVNMLLTAHPSSFSPLASVNYIAYAIIGGKGSMLGSVIGGTLLVVAADMFSARGEYSQFLFGLLIVIIVLVAKEGIFGGLTLAFNRLMPADRPKAAPSLSASAVTEGQR